MLFRSNTAEEINIQSVDKNPQLKSLDLILDKFEESKIDVILYLTPHNLEYLDRLSDVDKENFSNIVKHIENNHNIHVNSLMQNYTLLEIWNSPNHITRAPQGSIYNEDIARMITEET